MSLPGLTRPLPWIAVAIGFPVVSGLVSLSLGRDSTFDFLNYHFYNAYAFLHNRLNYDIAPAGFQTFFNPALDLPVYWMMRHLSARAVGFILGFTQGLNFPLVFLVYWKICLISNRRWKVVIGLCVVAVAFVAPGFVAGLGNALGDDMLAIFTLSSLLALILVAENLAHQRRFMAGFMVAAGGLAMGLAVGLKPVILPYAFGSAIAMLFLFDSWRDRIRHAGLYAIAAASGDCLTTGSGCGDSAKTMGILSSRS